MACYFQKDALIWEALSVKVRIQEVIVSILCFIGEFGVVYRGTLNYRKDDMSNLVAIKTLKGTFVKPCFTSDIILCRNV